ncbi:hypothetical protein [Janthinobacterium agaricidamnosum]|uniref:Uncharacterized protein n=1 Tax=Janthinobacterium agaricidamnosum NBRC 102515 = DSM 9628 TaxID=1349767 RepID=W0V5N8_9BURK|nr:hypothetical protein [Janthinobacterium agaricidamnosum]CDG82668.1 hypothetical protein GJA_2032 [Janthinobacterium agaricidamnosum NBRC 102515 = DSM 9628]
MNVLTQEYRGYTIRVTPFQDHDDLWDFTYQLSKDGGPAIDGSQTLGGHLTAEIAGFAGVEVARIEVDNLLALDRA